MKLIASTAEIPEALDMVAQLMPAAKPAITSIKSGLEGVEFSGTLTIKKKASTGTSTLEIDLSP